MQQPNQQPLYRVTGQLPRGFQGHIAYTTLLPEDLRALRIVFTFDKREPQQDLEALHRDCLAAAAKNGVPVEGEFSGPLAQRLCAMPKGEIKSKDLGDMTLHRLAHLDDVAYIRFASVYKDFKNVEEFAEALKEIKEGES